MSTLEHPLSGRCLALPDTRGPYSERLFAALREHPGAAVDTDGLPVPERPLHDHDLQLALYVLNELHYAGFHGVEDGWEWSPALAPLRARLEDVFERALDELVGGQEPEEGGESVGERLQRLVAEDGGPPLSRFAEQRATREQMLEHGESVGERLQRLVAEDGGPPLSRFAEQRATREQMLEHVVHRSAYQLKEADPHSFAIPRLDGGAKAALVEIQFDEYGEGRAPRMHSAMFAATMRGLGLDDSYGAYLSWLPGITLANVNLMSLFGLHRRHRGALVGHLAVFEMTSSIPNRRYGNALRRLGYGPEVTAFYDEHVEADAVHESIAAWDLADGLARQEPALAEDIVYGARALLALEAAWGGHVLAAWEADRCSLLAPLRGG